MLSPLGLWTFREWPSTYKKGNEVGAQSPGLDRSLTCIVLEHEALQQHSFRELMPRAQQQLLNGLRAQIGGCQHHSQDRLLCAQLLLQLLKHQVSIPNTTQSQSGSRSDLQ